MAQGLATPSSGPALAAAGANLSVGAERILQLPNPGLSPWGHCGPPHPFRGAGLEELVSRSGGVLPPARCGLHPWQLLWALASSDMEVGGLTL